jgi:hypothetical protein
MALESFWDNSDADNDGNNLNNWSLGNVPQAGEVAIFDATTDGNCTFSAGLTCDGIWALPDYSGNVDFGDSKTYEIGDSGLQFNHQGTLDWGIGSTYTASGNLNSRDVNGAVTYGTSIITLMESGVTWYIGSSKHHYRINIPTGVLVNSDYDGAGVTYCYGGIYIDGTLNVGGFIGVRDSDLVINDGGILTGNNVWARNTDVTLNSGGVVNCDLIEFVWPNSTVVNAGNYDCTFKFTGSASTLVMGSGTITCDSFEAEAGFTGDITVDFATNPCAFIVEGATTIDLNSTGDIIFDFAGGTSTIDLQGDVIREITGGGSYIWNTGSGDPETLFSSTSDQDVEFPTGFALGRTEINKSAGRLKWLDDTSFESLTITDGTVDWNGKSFVITENFIQTGGDWAGASLSGVSFDVNGNLNLTSTAIDMDASGTWFLDVAGTANVANATVAWSNAGSGNEITATNSTDNDNNINWSFGAAEVSPTTCLTYITGTTVNNYRGVVCVTAQGTTSVTEESQSLPDETIAALDDRIGDRNYNIDYYHNADA